MGHLLKQFSKDARGNVAMLFGLGLIPVMAASGAAIDYSSASNVRSALQSAADAAALAGAKARITSNASARAEASKVFAANLQVAGISEMSTPKITFVGTGGVRVEGVGSLDMKFMKFVGKNSIDVAYMAEANMAVASADTAGAGEEISLVLDNTGSMSNDMVALRQSAGDFVEKVMTGTTRMSVVPFVTAVNVGSRNLSNNHLDTRSQSQWHGIFTRYMLSENKARGTGYIAHVIGYARDGCNYGGGGSSHSGPGNGGKGASLHPRLPFNPAQWDLASSLVEIFGISVAHAQAAVVMPNTVRPLQGKMVGAGTFSKTGQQVFLPDGFSASYHGCHLDAPTKVNHFDLLKLMPGATWKGCVEARPEPYDVTDDAPTSGRADSLYTPYFWPDEQDPEGDHMRIVQNNYMSDGVLPDTWGHRERFANILKYDGINRPRIVETAPDTSGPNKACPSEIQRLTSDKAAVKKTVQGMQHWNGGGTILVEGLAWGWRSLSPNAPLADGKPYSKDAKKTIIFMSDGDNEMGDASDTPLYSHYTGYGYLASGRFPVAKFKDAHNYLDERFLLACKNAKDKGIRIITILFRNREGNSVSMMQKCATDKSDFHFAGSQQALKTTFDKIGGQLSSTALRLSK